MGLWTGRGVGWAPTRPRPRPASRSAEPEGSRTGKEKLQAGRRSCVRGRQASAEGGCVYGCSRANVPPFWRSICVGQCLWAGPGSQALVATCVSAATFPLTYSDMCLFPQIPPSCPGVTDVLELAWALWGSWLQPVGPPPWLAWPQASAKVLGNGSLSSGPPRGGRRGADTGTSLWSSPPLSKLASREPDLVRMADGAALMCHTCGRASVGAALSPASCNVIEWFGAAGGGINT